MKKFIAKLVAQTELSSTAALPAAVTAKPPAPGDVNRQRAWHFSELTALGIALGSRSRVASRHLREIAANRFVLCRLYRFAAAWHA